VFCCQLDSFIAYGCLMTDDSFEYFGCFAFVDSLSKDGFIFLDDSLVRYGCFWSFVLFFLTFWFGLLICFCVAKLAIYVFVVVVI
jgi:hypothetical protein